MRFRTGEVVYDKERPGRRGPYVVLGVFWTPSGEVLHLSWRGEPITHLLSKGQQHMVDCLSTRYTKEVHHDG